MYVCEIVCEESVCVYEIVCVCVKLLECVRVIMYITDFKRLYV